MRSGHPRAHAAAASFWHESYRELRRHAGDDRLPYRLRVRLRGAADRAFARHAREEARAVVPLCDRRAIRTAARVELPAADIQAARELATALGVSVDRPLVTIEPGRRADLLAGALEILAREGCQMVRIGNPSAGPLRRPGVLDVTASPHRTPALMTHLLLTSTFVICSSADLQQQAYLTHTPSLRIDARDPFTAFPVRPDGLFTLATPVDLDTGRALAIPELLTERYFRNTRNYGYRGTGAGDIAAAVGEMLDGVRHGWRDSDAQARFRGVVADAGTRLGPHVRHIAEWDAAGGFVGDGRLARVQAERAL